MAIQTTGTLQAAGIGSGLDINSLVSQLVAAERKPDDDRLSAAETKANTQLSAVGQLKSAVASFQSSLSTLTASSAFSQRTVTLADGNKLFTATANATAQLGAYQVEVDTLAQAQKLLSGPYASADATLDTGQLVLKVGQKSATIQVTAKNNTLAGIAAAINSAGDNPGVRATVVTGVDGAHLVLTATATGTAGTVTVTATDDAPASTNALTALQYGPGVTGGLTQTQAAGDASLKIDGLAVTSSTNTISDAIPGVTITLLDKDPTATNTLTVNDDQATVTGNINQFVQSYNALIKVISGLTSYNADTNQAGPLFGSSVARDLKAQVRREISALSTDPNAPFRSISDIGIQFAVDGTLQVNSNKLTAALQKDFDAVGQLFAAKTGGLAVRLGNLANGFLDGSSGSIAAQTQSLQNQLKSIQSQKSALDARMLTVQATYQAQFSAMDALVAQLKSTSNYLAQQLTSNASGTGG